MWLIRTPGGEHRRFRELTTLQQWIVERKVTRDSEISRSGETWKRLGEIAELSAFFAIVDQAQASPRPSAAVDRRTQPFASAQVAPARPLVAPPPAALADTAADLERSPQFATTAHLPPSSRPAPAASPGAAGSESPAQASWRGPAVGGAVALADAATAEPAWTANKEILPDIDDEVVGEGDEKHKRTFKVAPGSLGDFSAYEDYQPRQKSRAWIGITALVIGAGALGGWLLLREQSPAATTNGAAAPAPATTPPPTVASIAPDAAAMATPPGDADYREGLARLAEDTDSSFAAAEKAFEKARVADAAADARAAAGAALVSSSLAQYLLDDASLATDAHAAAELRAESARRLIRAERLAREAESKDPKSPQAMVAMADVLRLENKPAAEIEKRLLAAGDDAEAHYVRGMLLLREGKTDEAQASLQKAIEARVQQGATHLRARYRLASLALAAGKTDAAREQLEGILAAQPQHARAKTLVARLSAPPVASAPPAPAPTPAPAPVPAPATPRPHEATPPRAPAAGDLGSGPIASSAYGGLVEKGDKLAENGDCGTAMRYYERALDARPGGVEALTGLGYCYLDRKEYGRAISSFRAALGISSRYTEALIGIAEAYRFQGLTADALTYYKKYLEQAPGGPKAAMARRQVEALSPAQPAEPDKPAAPPPAPPSGDRLPDKPGMPPEDKPATTPATPAPTPAPETAPPVDKLPDKPAPPADKLPDKPAAEPAPASPPAGEPAAPEPPPPRQSDPAAPDSPKQ